MALICTSCSTQKNTFVSRQYHNVTAYYNYYYNANDIYKMALKNSEKKFHFNYTLPVPMLLLGEEQTTSSVSGEMDKSIEKCTNLIAKHSITVKPQNKHGFVKAKDKNFYNQNEFVRWSREAWFLIAQAQAWKGDLDKSDLAFDYIVMRFPNTDMYYSAQVWKARIAILRADFVDAADKLSAISNNSRRPRTEEFKHLLASTYAFFHLKQNEAQQAIPYIKTAISNAPRRSDKLRYTYLLAQIQQQLGEKASAANNYAKAMHLNPSYEMAFSIKINMIALGGVKGADLKKALLKLAKDDKNRDYLDQLYYTLGNLENELGNEGKAIEYFKLSAQKSTENDNQKGMSYLMLANYYFNKTEYTQAQGYFDSSITVLDKNYPNYEEIATKTHFLNNLVKHLNVVKLEDSLLHVASLPKAERDAIIAELIKKVQEEEEAQRLAEQEDRQRSMQYQQSQQYRNSNTNTEEAGKWYFYNQTSQSYGQSEFQLKWGKRKLADDWRRKNKTETLVEPSIAENADTSANGEPRKDLSNRTPEFYLAKLPMTDSLKSISNKKIKEALLKAAEIYQIDLKDFENAKETYMLYIKKYPTDAATAEAYYNLYKIAREQNKTDEMQSYKGLLISNYPKSPYALMLSNPAYVESLKTQLNEQETHYQNTYNLYSEGNYSKALACTTEGLDRFQNSKNAPKYMLIQAMCTGKISGTAEMKKMLSAIIDKFPQTEEQEQAALVMRTIEARELQIASGNFDYAQTQPDTSAQASIFAEPQGEHMLVVLIPKKMDINQFKFNMISFNVDFYIDADLNVTNQPFSDFVEIITVTGLKDSKMAMEYYNRVIANNSIFGELQKSDYQVFAISIENYAKFLEEKSIPNYLKFFKQNY